MKIYISLPITGHDIEEVEASCIYASGVIQAKGHTPVSPLAYRQILMQLIQNTWVMTSKHC